jgi:O-antigen ligase
MRKHLNLILLILFFASSIIPPFESIDVIFPQWLYLSIYSIISIFIIYTYGDPKNNRRPFQSKYLKLLFVFISICFVSTFFAKNQVESILVMGRIVLIPVLLYLVILYVFSINKPIETVTFIMCGLLAYELYLIYDVFFEITKYTNYDFSFANYLKGNTGNKNIAAASIMTKIPFVILLFERLKNKLLQVMIIILLFGSLLAIIMIGARATILSGCLFFLLYFGFVSKQYFVNKTSISHSVPIMAVLALVFLANNFLFQSNSAALETRVADIANYKDDYSTQSRLRYYSHGVQQIINNPLMGCGIGNWKLKSIDYDKENIENYVVPYNLHNDFLEIGAETGLLGMLIYITIFFLFFKQTLLKVFISKGENYNESEIFCIGGSMLIYFVDANLNFPFFRVIMLIQFITLLALASYYTFNKAVNEN